MASIVDESAGWRGWLQKNMSRHRNERDLLRAAMDRVLEAQFFAEHATQVNPSPQCIDQVNWFLSAFVAALSGVRDAAKADFYRIGHAAAFEHSAIAREFFLVHDDPDPMRRDPRAFNRAFWDMRNLRVHYAVPIVELRTHLLAYDLAENPRARKGAPRWYVRPIDPAEIRQLRKPQISAEGLSRFNDYVSRRPLADVLYHHLCTVVDALDASANELAVQPTHD